MERSARFAHLAALEPVVICLGCGTKHLSEVACPTCHERLKRCLTVFSHWPLETSISPAALSDLHVALTRYLHTDGGSTERSQAELRNLANTIRAHLQHIPKDGAYSDNPTDEELLS